MFTVNLAAGLQLEKLIVIGALAVAPEAIDPREIGKAAGAVTTGVHAGPKVCVNEKPVTRALFAAPGPSLFRDIVHTLALLGPFFPAIEPTREAVPVPLTT